MDGVMAAFPLAFFFLFFPSPAMAIPSSSGRPRNLGPPSFPGGGLQWPRQTLFGKQVTILSGSIFLPVPFPPRPRAQLQNFLNSNPSVEFNGASENEVPFHLPYLLPSIWLVCYKALVAFHNHSASDLNCTAFHSPISPLSTLPPHLFVGPVGSPLGMGSLCRTWGSVGPRDISHSFWPPCFCCWWWRLLLPLFGLQHWLLLGSRKGLPLSEPLPPTPSPERASV